MSNLFAIPDDISPDGLIRCIEAVADYQDGNADHTPAPPPRPLSPTRLSTYQREVWHSLVARGWRQEDATKYVRRMA